MHEYEIYESFFLFLMLFLFIFIFFVEIESLALLYMYKLSKDRVLPQLFFTDLCNVFVGMNLKLHKFFPNFITSDSLSP